MNLITPSTLSSTQSFNEYAGGQKIDKHVSPKIKINSEFQKTLFGESIGIEKLSLNQAERIQFQSSVLSRESQCVAHQDNIDQSSSQPNVDQTNNLPSTSLNGIDELMNIKKSQISNKPSVVKRKLERSSKQRPNVLNLKELRQKKRKIMPISSKPRQLENDQEIHINKPSTSKSRKLASFITQNNVSLNTKNLESNLEITTKKTCSIISNVNTANTNQSEDDIMIEDIDILEMMEYLKYPELISPIEDLFDDVSTNIENIDHYDSPASPPPSERLHDNTAVPKTIPIHTEVNENVLINEIIKNYNWKKRKIFEAERHKNELYSNDKLFVQLRRIIEIYLTAIEWTSDSVQLCCARLLSVTHKAKPLAECILELIEDTIDEPLITHNITPPAPALTESQKRLVLLVHKLSNFISKFQEFCLYQLDKFVFTLNPSDKNIKQLVSVTRFFLGLGDTLPMQNNKIRLFIYKCFYYFQHKSIPMVYTVLLAHPQCLPVLEKGCEINDELWHKFDPIVQALQAILINTRYIFPPTKKPPEDPSFMKIELNTYLTSYYNYPMYPIDQRPYEELINSLICRIRQNQLHNVSYALIIVAKKKGIQWALNNIIDLHLLPLLNEYMAEVDKIDDNDEKIATIIFSMSSILKTMIASEDITRYQQKFMSLLDATERQRIQEAAIEALLQTSRFGVVNVYHKICTWNPTFCISRKLLAMLNSFIHRKPLNFWE